MEPAAAVDSRNVDPGTVGLPVQPTNRGSTYGDARWGLRSCDLCYTEFRCTITFSISIKSILCLETATRIVIASVFSNVMGLLWYNLLFSTTHQLYAFIPPSHSQIRRAEARGRGRTEGARTGGARSTLLMPIHLAPCGGGERGRG